MLLGPDLEEELPVLAPARAPRRGGARRAARRPRAVAHGLSRARDRGRRARVPGEALDADALAQIGRARGDRPGPVVVVLGRPSLAESAAVAVARGRRARAFRDVRFLSALRRGNVHGALDAGLVPGFLPGRVTLDAGREWFADAWGAASPRARGLDARRHPRGRGRRARSRCWCCSAADPVADFPDADLARRGIAGVST